MYQTQISTLIIRLKKARNANPEMTLQKISDSTGVSMSTVTRIFADGSENQSFRYESLKPIAMLLLGSDGLSDDMDADEIQLRLSQQKEKYEKKLDKEREQHQRSLDFLKHQIDLKDDRITLLLNALADRSAQYKELHYQYEMLMKQLMRNKESIDHILEKE